MSEIDFEEDLALPWRVSLARREVHGSILENGPADSPEIRAVVDTQVGVTDLHAVEKIQIFHSEFGRYALAEKESFG